MVQLALIHAQFEIIHPFNDGNGRLGRMLIPLILYQNDVLQRPMFYLVNTKKNDNEYRDRLLAITEEGNWQGWVEFFLQAIFEQSQRNTEKAAQIHKLYENLKEKIRESTHSQCSGASLDAFFKRPILNTADFIQTSSIQNRGTANTILKALVNDKIIVQLREGSGPRSAIYALPSLINISEGREVLDN